MPVLNLFIDTSSNQLVSGTTNAAIVNAASLPLFYGDSITLQIWLLQPAPVYSGAGGAAYQVIPTNGISLQLYLDDGTIGGTTYTQQVAFATDPNNQYFIGSLPLNTAPMLTLMTGKTTATVALKVGYLQNGGLQTTVLSTSVNINVGLPQNQLVVPPGLTPLAAETANQTYVPIRGVAGGAIQVVSPAGIILTLHAVDNGDGTASPQWS